MKAQELRIGNYINTSALGDFKISKKDMIDIIKYDGEMHMTNPTKPVLKPIPLTEEWLLKFGFDKDLFVVDDENQKTSDVVYRIDKDKFVTFSMSAPKGNIWFPMLKNKDGGNWLLYGIKHVHQLQNLYFALTGEELTIKENANS